MALSGSFSGTTSNSRIKPTLTWSAVQSVEGNYSDITVILTYCRNNNYTTAGNWSGSITVGQQVVSGACKLTITDQETEAMRTTARVYHDEYGELQVRISATGSISGSTLTSTTVSGTVTPDTIARASAISAADAWIGSRATVVVSRKNDSFTHSIAYSFGGLSGYMDASGNPVDHEVRFGATTVNFLLPETFYNQIPNASQGVCTLTCRTYSGSTLIGTAQTAAFNAIAAYVRCKPVVSGTVLDANEQTAALTGDASVLVRYCSEARCEISAQAQNGASIAVRRIDGIQTQSNSLIFQKPAADRISFEAVDSRGYASVCQVTVPLIPYVLLTGNAVAQRTEPTSSDVILTLQGNCWKGNFGTADNTLTATVQVGDAQPQTLEIPIGENHKYYKQLSLSGLAYTQAYTVKVTVWDQAMSVQQVLTVKKGIPVFDWGEADFRFHVPVEVAALTVGGISLENYIRAIVEGG